MKVTDKQKFTKIYLTLEADSIAMLTYSVHEKESEILIGQIVFMRHTSELFFRASQPLISQSNIFSISTAIRTIQNTQHVSDLK